METDCDVAVLGSGFAGTLTAMLLRQCGLRPIVIDRARHPRFTIGESTTPIANMVLADLARRYSLPQLLPLCKYGSWQRSYPTTRCGLKRGFSYFSHRPGIEFQPGTDHANELLVAASADDEFGDTHWFRADVDAQLVCEARHLEIDVLEGTSIEHLEETPSQRWIIGGVREGRPIRVSAGFVVDASGPVGLLPRRIPGNDVTHRLQTRSQATYSHFDNVPGWQEQLKAQGGVVRDHPFGCDDAAQHHLCDDGWMWVLRFDSGITSVGWVADCSPEPRRPLNWDEAIHRYPSFQSVLGDARVADPPGQFMETSRLQRLWSQFVGPNWAALPHTAGFVDPLHSTGIAQTMCGIERLVRILERDWHSDRLPASLSIYQQTVHAELRMIDRLVAGCYRTLSCFPLFVSYAMLYFAAATTYEQRRGQGDAPAAFLGADDRQLAKLVDSIFETLPRVIESESCEEFAQQVSDLIRPYNHVGLFAPEVPNMYRYTAATNS